jgi:hypothetical protein
MLGMAHVAMVRGTWDYQRIEAAHTTESVGSFLFNVWQPKGFVATQAA